MKLEKDKNIKEIITIIKEQISFNKEVVLQNLIGIGGIGKVYKFDINDINKSFAIKVISNKLEKNIIMPYINFLKNFKKPFLAKMYTYIEDDNYYYIIMDYYEFNLSHYIINGLSIEKIFRIYEKLNAILSELNSKNMYFRNIKPENIFILNDNGNLDGNFNIVLSDCSQSYVIQNNDYYKKYLPPKTRLNNVFEINTDIWSLGKLFLQLILSIYLEKMDYYGKNYVQCIKYFKMINFLNGLMDDDSKSRTNWETYFKEFNELKNEMAQINFDEQIDFSRFTYLNCLNDLFHPENGFDNIIIQLTELSNKNYVNDKILSDFNFDKRGNRLPYEYSKDQQRGNMEYEPPFGWTGIGLNITFYDNWEIKCGNKNQQGEWCVSYHGTSLSNAKNIIMEGLQKGSRQFFQNKNDEKGEKIGIGVYFSPYIKIAETYSTAHEGIKCVFMCRVNPDTVKKVKNSKIYVINNPDVDIIPYRLLIKWD